jgi:hypothetical protein
MDTYNEDYAKMNHSSIVKRIRQLFKKRLFYDRDQLFNEITIIKPYPEDQIDFALSRFVDNKNEYVYDEYGLTGYLINKDKYHVFQPIEITQEDSSILDSSISLDSSILEGGGHIKQKKDNIQRIVASRDLRILLNNINVNKNILDLYKNINNKLNKDIVYGIKKKDNNYRLELYLYIRNINNDDDEDFFQKILLILSIIDNNIDITKISSQLTKLLNNLLKLYTITIFSFDINLIGKLYNDIII